MKGGRLQKMQVGGRPNPQDYDDPYMYQQALDEWEMSQQSGMPNIDLSGIAPPPMTEADIIAPPPVPQPTGPQYRDRIQEGIAKGIIEGPKNFDGSAMDWYNWVNTPPDKKKKKNPYQVMQDIGLGMQAARTGLGWLSGAIERGRQNQYDMMQQTALGQMNPMPVDDFQPNPYNLYMQQGGNLKTIMEEFQKFSNPAAMDMGDGMLDDKGMMKKGGYEIDRMMIVRKLLPELLKFGRLGSGKYRNYKKGGIHIKPENKGKFTDYCGGKVTDECIQRGLNSSNPTTRKRANFARNARKWNKEEGGMTYKKGGLTPNKAREILHDGTAQGHPLTDKQRRFFGAMSKGHTNYRGK